MGEKNDQNAQIKLPKAWKGTRERKKYNSSF